jgi:tripartite-type tricarboxylate transporter receptor subunit TctC
MLALKETKTAGGTMLRRLAIVVAALAALTGNAAAQGGNPFRILVGVTPGASTDTIARLLADKLKTSLNETVIVENKTGAAQRIAMQELLKAPADGRTIFLGSNSVYSILPHIYGDQTGYDPFKDAMPISRIVAFQVGIGAGNQTGVTNIKEFIAWAKANPGKVSFASPGAGTSSHFAGVMLSNALNIPMTHVPYRGTVPALADIIGGHIPLLFTAYPDLVESAKAGKLKIVATAGYKRSPATPDTPTLKEQDVNIAFDSSFDMHAKAGTSPDVIKKLHEALAAAVKDPEVNAKLSAMGLVPIGSTPEELTKMQADEYKFWDKPVKDSGYKGD